MVGRLSILVFALAQHISVVSICAAQSAQPVPTQQQTSLADLQQQVEELKAAFAEFKKTNTELAESLSDTSTTVLPVGSVVAFAGSVENIPANWKLCDGQSVSSADYALLWKRIGTTWGGSGGSTKLLVSLNS